MKHVWVVQCNDIGNTDYIAIYSSEKKAKEHIEFLVELDCDGDNTNEHGGEYYFYHKIKVL